MDGARKGLATTLAIGSLILSACESSSPQARNSATGPAGAHRTTSSAASSAAPASGHGPSASDIAARLRMDPEIAALETQLKSKAGAYDAYITCITKVIEKDVDPDRLRDYVDRKFELADLGNETLGKKIDHDSEQCIEDAAG